MESKKYCKNLYKKAQYSMPDLHFFVQIRCTFNAHFVWVADCTLITFCSDLYRV